MFIQRRNEGEDPVGSAAGPHEIRPAARTGVVAVGTLACPSCDAPVAPAGTVTPGAPMACPFCAHAAAVRDFLSLTGPSRPARVEIRVVLGAGRRTGAAQTI